MVRSGRGDDLEIAGDRSVRRSTHEAWDAHQIDACCVHQVLTDRHPSVPEGSSTIFVMRRGTTYAPRVGHKPMKLAMQYGMGTITQACGSTTTPHEPATTATTGVPSSPAPTTAPLAPSTTTVPPPPPTTAAPASCTPLSDSGICYEPGEYCRDSDHGATGRAGDGESITCEDNDGWRWEPS